MLAASTALPASRPCGTLRICGLNETAEEVFAISGFDTVFDVFSSESKAIEGF